MRIVVDARMADRSGIGRYVRGLLGSLGRVAVARGHKILAIVLPGGRTPGEHVTPVELEAPPLSAVEQWALARVLRRIAPAVVHSPQFNVPLLSGAVQVTTVHDLAYERYPAELTSVAKRIGYGLLMPAALRLSRRVITGSEATRAELLDRHGVPRWRVRVVHHGVACEFFREPGERGAARRRVAEAFGLEGPYLLYVGLVRPRKGVDVLLAAFAEARRMGLAHVLALAGPDDNRFLDIGRRAAELGIAGSVVRLGEVPDERLVDLYQVADALVFPSRYEGFGLPVLEAMACGTPVVASRIAAVAEVAGDAAWKVPPGDARALAEAMVRVTGDGPLRERLVGKGRERARAFGWEDCARETLNVYEEAAGK